MKFLLAIVGLHGITISSGLIVVLWYGFIFRAESRSALKLLIFPLAHFPKAFNAYENPPVLPILLGYITFLGCLIQLLLPISARIYIIFVWGSIVAYEIYGVTSYSIKIKTIRSFLICVAIILLIVGYVIARIIQLESYLLMNQFDFAVGIYLFIVSVYTLTQIIVKGRFRQNLEAFFVFFGVILYSFLHTLASSILSLGVIEHFNFAYYATLVTMLFWILVIPWIRHLKYKLT